MIIFYNEEKGGCSNMGKMTFVSNIKPKNYYLPYRFDKEDVKWKIEVSLAIRHRKQYHSFDMLISLGEEGFEIERIHPKETFDEYYVQKIKRIRHELFTSEYLQTIERKIVREERQREKPKLSRCDILKKDKRGKITVAFELVEVIGSFKTYLRYSKKKRMWIQYGVMPDELAATKPYKHVRFFEEQIKEVILENSAIRKELERLKDEK